MPVSTSKTVTLSAGDSADISLGPCVITSVIVTELSGSAPAAISLTGTADLNLLMTLVTPGGESVVWSGEPVVAGAGLTARCQYGDVNVTVAYR